MANNPKIANAGVNAEADNLCALLNAGLLRIYTGSQPATADTAVGAQTLLAEFTLGNPAFGSAVAGVATANAIAAVVAAATGTAAWFRALKSDATPVFDGSVGASGCDMNLDSTAIQINAHVSITSFTFTASKG